MHRRNAMTMMTTAVDQHGRAKNRSYPARRRETFSLAMSLTPSKTARVAGDAITGDSRRWCARVNSVHAAVDTFTIADWYDRFVALASAGAGAALAGFQV